MSKDRIPKGYATTGWGQVHYRRLGEGERALILLHWLPLSSRMYAPAMPLLAEAGFTVIAFDLLGYGRSDPRGEPWSFPLWAESVREAARTLRVERAALLGGHSGACVATELALLDPGFVTHLALDGCPFLTPELSATFAQMRAQSRPRPSADGAHERLAFQAAAGLWRHLRPGFKVDAEGLERIWPATIDYLETDFISSASISATYDLAQRLPLVAQPCLILGAEKDTLAASFATARVLMPNARAHFFEGHHPVHDPADAARYVAPLLAFLNSETPALPGAAPGASAP
jgi:pimeloyl-ACP methyl ester carboxylesterase